METKDLIDSIADGDNIEANATFKAVIQNKMLDKINDMRADVAKNMFDSAQNKK